MSNSFNRTYNFFQEKTYVAIGKDNRSVIIDPGFLGPAEFEDFLACFDSKGLHPDAILLTHGHFDHCCGVRPLLERYGQMPVYMNPSDKIVIEDIPNLAKRFGLDIQVPDFNTTPVADNENLTIAGMDFLAIATPGHTPGGMSYLLHDDGADILFSGDTLFAGAIGRTDLPYGEYDDEIRSIMEKLIVLGPDTAVYPGHGPATTIGRERTDNPFLEPFNEAEEESGSDAEPVIIRGPGPEGR